MAVYVQLTDRRTGEAVFVNPAKVANLQNIPTDLEASVGGAGTFITQLEDDGQIPVPELLAVTGTAAANAALLGGVLFTRLDGGGSVFVLPDSVETLRSVPQGLGGPGTYVVQVRPTGNAPPPGLLAVTGTPAATAAALAAATIGIAGLSTCLFVDPAGNDATAQRGSLTNKYRTISAAVAATVNGDTVVVAPGIYLEPAVINIPAARAIAIVGIGGSRLTEIQVPAGQNGIVVPANGSPFRLEGVTVVVGDNLVGVRAGATNAAQLQGLELVDVVIRGGANATPLEIFGAANYKIDRLVCSTTAAGGVTIRSSVGIIRGSVFDVGLLVTRTVGDTSDAGTGLNIIEGTRLVSLTLTEQARVHTLADVWIRFGVTANTLTVNAAPAAAPKILLEGAIGDPTLAGFPGDLDFTNLPTFDAANPTQIRVRLIGLAVATWSFRQTAAAPATPIDLDGADPFTGSTLSIRDNIAVSARDFPIQRVLLAGPFGAATLARDSFTANAVNAVGGANNVAIAPPFPNANYNVQALSNTVNDDPRVTAKAAGQVTITTTAANSQLDVLVTFTG